MKLTREPVYAVGHKNGYLQAVADANAESQPETPEQYFSRRDTPSRYSPTGNTMVRILAKYPEMCFDEARAKANELLANAAKARVYRGPVVRSEEELAKDKERLGRVFGKSKPPRGASTTPVPGVSSYAVQKNSCAHVVGAIPATQSLETALSANSVSGREALTNAYRNERASAFRVE